MWRAATPAKEAGEVMKPCCVFAGFALVSFCLAFGNARAQVITASGDENAADSIPAVVATDDLIFEGGFEGQENGGTSCATATVLGGGATYAADTTSALNWMSSFGPVQSPSDDVVYVFVAGPDVAGSITPTSARYDFAMYLIPSCAESGVEPTPIGATATVGRGIDLQASGVISGHTYYLAVTGTSSGGAGANGTVNFTTPFSIAVPREF
jgi:hypothetical protein